MPQAAPRSCSRCQKANYNKGPLCNECLENHSGDTRTPHPTDRLYDTQTWRRLSKTIRGLNPICQKLEYDFFTQKVVQCRRPSEQVHHMKSPREGGAMWDAKNLVALCREHHGPELRVLVAGVDIVATVLPKPCIAGAS